MKNSFLTAPSLDDLIRLLRAWRFWALGALLGGVLGAGVYAVFPPEYRAQAIVTVDFNMEKAWPENGDAQLFYYLDRETRKLVDVAWADSTLQRVAAKTGFSVPALRSGLLELSQPQDGGWRFYGNAPDEPSAVKLAAAWADAFQAQVQQGIQTEVALSAARKALEANPTDEKLKSSIKTLEAESLGITPELETSLAQVEGASVVRKTGQGTYILAGAGLVLALGALGILFLKK